jgi:hypothetical protein
VDGNNQLLIEILKQTIENGAAHKCCDGPDVIVNCGGACPCEECPPIDPGTGVPPVDNCLSETNVFVTG